MHAQREVDHVVVRLDGPPLAIAGVLVDAEGEPLGGVRVNTVEATPLGGVHGGAEGRFGGEDTTAADGSFRLEGLARRSYRLRFSRTDPPFFLESRLLAAGTLDARVEVPADWSRGALAGRVVDRAGRPVRAALVGIGMEGRTMPGGKSSTRVGAVRTDHDGRFRLTDVPRRGVTVQVGGAGVASVDFPVEELESDDVTLVVPREGALPRRARPRRSRRGIPLARRGRRRGRRDRASAGWDLPVHHRPAPRRFVRDLHGHGRRGDDRLRARRRGAAPRPVRLVRGAARRRRVGAAVLSRSRVPWWA